MNVPVLFEIVLKSSLILGCAMGISRLLRRQSAALRHIVWVLAFAGTLILPLTIPFAPQVNVPVAFWETSSYRPTVAQPTKRLWNKSAISGIAPVGGDNSTAPDPVQELLDEPLAWLRWGLFATWAVGFLFVLGRSLAGLYSLNQLRTTATRKMSAKELSADVFELEGNVGLTRPWELRQNAGDEPASALTWGIKQPVVLVPVDVHDWSRQRQEAVLLHELAHVRRFDFLNQMLAEVACALYWFNPLVWLGARALRGEAESAADDVVLRAGVRPSAYAEELLRIAAEIGHRRRLVTSPGIPVMNAKKIESRLESVLSPVTRRGLTQLQTLAALSLAIVAVPAIAGLQATAPQSDADKSRERSEALSRAKQIGLAVMMYTQDADDLYPYVQSTDSAIAVVGPYVRNQEAFQSPTKGGRFLFNTNVGGVLVTSIERPQDIPVWMESLPDSSLSPAYAFGDAHVKLLKGDALEKAKAAAAKHLPRAKGSKPLPRGYLVGNSIKP